MEELLWYATVVIAIVASFLGGTFLGRKNVPQSSQEAKSPRAPLKRKRETKPTSSEVDPPPDHAVIYPELISSAKEELLRNVASDAEGWSVVATKSGITISGKEEGDLNHMRGSALLDFPAEVVVAYLQTENKRSEWDKLVREDRIIERVDEQTVVVYNRFLGVFPVAPRDTCTLAHWFTCEDSRVFGGVRYATCSTSIEHHAVAVANTGGLVRAHLGCGGFVIDPVSENSCQIHSYAQIDLKGYIPKSLKKLLGQKQPMCIEKIRKCLEAAHPAAASTAPKVEDKKLHPLLQRNEIFIACGVHDVLSAKLAERAGFNSLVVSGYAVAASYLGEPDFGLLTQTEILDVARRVIHAVNIPVVVDGDTGHGGTLNVIHLVEQLLAMGARGVLLEDQTWPKRCGHMEGKSVVPMEEHVQKIRAAVHARGEDETFMITARTDGRLISLDEAIRRAKAYKDAGADFIFVEAPQTVEEIERIAREVPGPVVINNIEGGKTPILPIERLHELGFMSVGFVLSGIFACAQAMDEVFKHMVQHGSSAGVAHRLMHFDDFTDLVGLPERVALDAQFSSPA